MEENKQNIFQNIINYIVKYEIVIISIIVGIIGVLSIFITAYFDSTFYHPSEITYFKFSFNLISVLLSFVLIGAFILINKYVFKKVNSKVLLVILLIAMSIISIYWLNAMKLYPDVDQKMIDEMAKAFLDGNISNYLQDAQYLFLYPYQLAFTLFVALIYNIFGRNFIFVQYVNVICSIINTYIIYKITVKIFGNGSQNLIKNAIYLLALFSLHWVFFNTHFYGNILGLTFSLISVYLIILLLDNISSVNPKIKKQVLYAILSGIALSVACLIKSNYYIFLCGILISLLITLIRDINKRNILLTVIFIFSFICISLMYKGFVKYGLNISLPGGVPKINFIYMGIDEPVNCSPGWYSGKNAMLYHESLYNKENDVKKATELIHDRLSYFRIKPSSFIDFFAKKFGSTWLNPTFQTVWCSLPGSRYRNDAEYAHYISYHETALSILDGNLNKPITYLMKSTQILIFTFASIGIYKVSKESKVTHILLPVIFIGGLLFHLIWETKAIYVIQYYFILIPYAAYGLDNITKKVKTKKSDL